MKYGKETSNGRYYKESLTHELKSKITNEVFRKNINKIWLEHDEEDDADYIIIYFKEEQNEVWNVYDDVPMVSTQVPNYEMDDAERINDWLKEIAYLK